MKETILVIDTGSSSMRGILFDMAGKPLFISQIQYTMTVGDDGSAVMDAQIFRDTLVQLAKNASEEIRAKGYHLSAISLDSQRSSVLAVDEHVNPLYPILMWYDKRCSDICTDFSSTDQQTIFRLCGMRVTPVSSAPKMLWMKRYLPDIYQKAYKLIGIHDYLLYQITGRLVTDATCACRTALMDIKTFQWSQPLLDLFEIDRDKLCRILPGGSLVGQVTKAFCALTGLPQVPVVSAGGDQQCCILGQHLTDAGVISVNSGSASYLSIPVSRHILDAHMEVNLSAYYGRNPWILEASNMGSGTVYQWFNRTFYRENQNPKDVTRINQEVAAQFPGCQGLICFPDFAGRGCPSTNPHARGMFFGAGLQHTRGDFARAILEGICFDIDSCVRYIRASGVAITRIQSTGGLTRFDTFNQILSDISGLPVMVNAESETTAVGAWLAACDALALPRRGTENPSPKVYFPIPDHQAVYAQAAQTRNRIRKDLADRP